MASPPGNRPGAHRRAPCARRASIRPALQRRAGRSRFYPMSVCGFEHTNSCRPYSSLSIPPAMSLAVLRTAGALASLLVEDNELKFLQLPPDDEQLCDPRWG